MLTQALITTRQTILPRRLQEPGPTPEQVQAIFQAVAAAPDHGELLPWRFVVVGAARRDELGTVFAAALRERDPQASEADCTRAHEKALRAPFLALAIVDLGPREPDIATPERLVSLGAALQNALLMAHSLGLASSLTSGHAMESQALRHWLALRDDEHAVCCLNLGTATRSKPARLHPQVHQFVTFL
ncbi:MAG: nitroreductase family protein [Rhodoferax sp.]